MIDDCLALLDQVIDRLSKPEILEREEREEREVSRVSAGFDELQLPRVFPSIPVANCETGIDNSLVEKALPGLPVVPVPKREVYRKSSLNEENVVATNSQRELGRASYPIKKEREEREEREVSRVSAVKTVPVALPVDGQEREEREVSRVSAGFDEIAAIIERDAGVPRDWAEGLASLTLMRPLSGFTQARWNRLVDGACNFIGQWGAAAAACGWTVLDIFGCHPTAPIARFDAMGVALLLDRREVIDVDADGADLVSKSGDRVRSRYYRRPLPAETVPLWDLSDGHPGAASILGADAGAHTGAVQISHKAKNTVWNVKYGRSRSPSNTSEPSPCDRGPSDHAARQRCGGAEAGRGAGGWFWSAGKAEEPQGACTGLLARHDRAGFMVGGPKLEIRRVVAGERRVRDLDPPAQLKGTAMLDPRIIALFFGACDALRPGITFTRDELLDVLRKLGEIFPDDAAVTRFSNNSATRSLGSLLAAHNRNAGRFPSLRSGGRPQPAPAKNENGAKIACPKRSRRHRRCAIRSVLTQPIGSSWRSRSWVRRASSISAGSKRWGSASTCAMFWARAGRQRDANATGVAPTPSKFKSAAVQPSSSS